MEDIFKEIDHIMHHDYAGWKDKIGWDDPAYFYKKWKKQMWLIIKLYQYEYAT